LGAIELSTRAFRSRENAQAECDHLNTGRDTHYSVMELQVSDDEFESYDAVRDQIKEARVKALELARQEFSAGCKALFESHPKLESFGWRQYTPSYCDGAPCSLVVWYTEPDINGIDGDEVDGGMGMHPESGEWVRLREPSLERKLQGAVADFLSRFAAEDFGEMFGDGVQITVQRNGEVEIEAYY